MLCVVNGCLRECKWVFMHCGVRECGMCDVHGSIHVCLYRVQVCMLCPWGMCEGVSTGVQAASCIVCVGSFSLPSCEILCIAVPMSLCPQVHVCFTCGCMGGVHSWHAQMHRCICRYHVSCLGLDACMCLFYMPDNRLGWIVHVQVQSTWVYHMPYALVDRMCGGDGCV